MTMNEGRKETGGLWGGIWEVVGISSDKGTFEQRPEDDEGADRAAFWGKTREKQVENPQDKSIFSG